MPVCRSQTHMHWRVFIACPGDTDHVSFMLSLKGSHLQQTRPFTAETMLQGGGGEGREGEEEREGEEGGSCNGQGPETNGCGSREAVSRGIARHSLSSVRMRNCSPPKCLLQHGNCISLSSPSSSSLHGVHAVAQNIL